MSMPGLSASVLHPPMEKLMSTTLLSDRPPLKMASPFLLLFHALGLLALLLRSERRCNGCVAWKLLVVEELLA